MKTIMDAVKNILKEKEYKPDPRIWYERAYMFLDPKEAKFFCEKLKIFCSVPQDEQNLYTLGAFRFDQWPLTSQDFEYLANTLEFLAKKYRLSCGKDC